MTRMLAKRLLFTVLALIVISIVVFAATEALPGDAALAKLGKQATPEALKHLREQMNLNAPIYVQYWDWLVNLGSGNLGTSLMTSTSVTSLIGSKVGNSLVLMILSGVIGIPVASVLGVWMAMRRERIGDHVMGVGMIILAGMPEFVISVLLVAFLATNVFHILPAVSLVDPSRSVLAQPDILVLPTLTLVLLTMPYVSRTVRACMIEALDSDYVAIARLKGLPERQVIFRHAIPNIAGPAFQVAAQSLAYLAGGVVVIETVFQYPGIGYGFLTSIQTRDLPVIQTLALLLAAFYILVNAIADIGTVAMTPTMRKGSR